MNEGIRVPAGDPLRRVRYRPHQAHWIICACRDRRCDLARVTVNPRGQVVTDDHRPGVSYSQIFAVIAEMLPVRRKHWVAGFRMRYLLDKADWLGQLERGLVQLPESRSSDAEPTRAGRMVIGPNCLDLDLCIGKANVKFVDLDNFGLCPRDLGHHLQRIKLADVADSLAGLLGVYDYTGLRLTKTSAAQVGWQMFRARHQPPLLMFHRYDEVRALERRAYFGGRCEAFRLGVQRGIFHSVDICSCYADICQREPMPAWCDEFFPDGVELGAVDPHGQEHWLADCVINTDQPLYPLCDDALPIFPVGRFLTTLTWPELRMGLVRGHVESIECAARYFAGPVFRGFAKWYLRMRPRVRGSKFRAYEQPVKCAFNAALGFAARQGRTWKSWDTHVGFDWWMGVIEPPDGHAPVCSAHILDGVAEYLSIGDEPREASPALHATVCAYARVRLAELARHVGWSEVLYWDTDGLLLGEEGYHRLASDPARWGTLPGQLRDRFPPGAVIIRGQKCYEIGEHRIHAGLTSAKRGGWGRFARYDTPTGQVTTDGRVVPWRYDCLHLSRQGRQENQSLHGFVNRRLL